jgi:hypothetical protein
MENKNLTDLVLPEETQITKTQETSLVEMLANTNIIQENDYELLAESKQFIVDAYKSVPMYRPLVLKLFGVLNNSDFPTVDSKYWQCKVEAEVHANELIRELHDLELQKIQIERAKSILNRIIKKFNEELNTEIKQEVELDIKEQKILISKKQFELLQLQKKIKYRIEEVVQWKKISANLELSKDFKNKNYGQMLADSLCNKWQNQIGVVKSEEEKIGLRNQIEMMRKLSEDMQKIKNQ